MNAVRRINRTYLGSAAFVLAACGGAGESEFERDPISTSRGSGGGSAHDTDEAMGSDTDSTLTGGDGGGAPAGDDGSPATGGVSASATGHQNSGTTSDDGVGTTDSGPQGESTDGGDGSAGESNDSGDPGSYGTIEVTLSGCNVDFGGRIIAVYNGSLGVSSIYNGGASLSGSFQFDLDSTGAHQLSTQHRIDTGIVVNMVDPGQGTWTNIDSEAHLPGAIDRISGTLHVDQWAPSSGQTRMRLERVRLLNVSTHQVCQIDGTIETTDLYP